MHGIKPELETLAGLFYGSLSELGQFEEVAVGKLPEPYRRLLAHTSHMTVTMEQHYGCSVDVRVLDLVKTPTHYARKIVLSRQTDQRVVQFGIMRINWAHVSPEVRAEIESERTPLGRVLIQHGVLRSVQLYNLWHVTPGPDLRWLFQLHGPTPTYGRTALIEFEGDPAIELVEIVAPLAPNG